jgi:SAM-dependent methyltransferase
MPKQSDKPLTDIADYYSAKLSEHGRTANGVDWNGEESQVLRFAQLSSIIGATGEYSINDIGCGYGALYDYLKSRSQPFTYVGIDISGEMIDSATEHYRDSANARFIQGSEPREIADYSVASGIFNVRLDHSDEVWNKHIEDALTVLDTFSSKAFAFNCLTSYSDPERMRDYLYYPNPEKMFALCKNRFSRNVALLHDYDLYEFTILVRKNV